MSYTALYRKFRPLTFNEIVGQEHITKTLKNQIIASRVGHAYLFNGGRGTGKTSAAKVLARAINCQNPKDGEPCNECEICKAILAGTLTDVVEMDAASNNGVDDIRAIRDEVNFLPTIAKYRVYIIDEVHMLSTAAFNALLKTLEEPPSHVKFILATTEPQKLPATILSRCQRFDFARLSNESIEKRLKYVCDESNIKISTAALNLIAQLAEGAMRDALSILERCLQDGEKEVEIDKIKELVGIPKIEYINKILNAIIDYNSIEAFEIIEEILNRGKDINYLIWEIIKYTKDVLVYKTSGKLYIYSKEELEEIKKLSEKVDKQRLFNIIYDLSILESDIKYSSQKNIMFQVGILKLSNVLQNKTISSSENCISNTELNALKSKIMQLEQKINSKETTIIHNVETKVEKQDEKPTKIVKKEAEKIIKDEKINANKKELNFWNDIINELKSEGKIMLVANLSETKAFEINDLIVGIEFKKDLSSFAKSILEKYENMEELRKKISLKLGKDITIKYIYGESKQIDSKLDNNLENMIKDLDIPINIIEE